jgi:hypothetical protein
MPELTFAARGAEPVRTAAGPTIGLHLDVSCNPPEQAIQSAVLHCQVQIEASQRQYDADEAKGLRDVFGEPEGWGRTLRPLLWANVMTTVPGFTGSTGITVAVPCTFDLNITASKYFHAIEGGTVPVSLFFSGLIFYRGSENLLQAAPIPWNTEAHFALAAGIWKECIDLHHPNTAWLELRRDVFQRLYEFKVRHGLANFDDAVERMMANDEVEA